MSQAAVEIAPPLNFIVDSIRERANSELDEKVRGKLGQFMSTSAVSELLAGMFETSSGDISLLDAGAGVGSLTAAFVQQAASCNLSSLHATCYEISDILYHHLQSTLKLCEEEARGNGISWGQDLFKCDFIEHSVNELSVDGYLPKYNKAILNPPYLKISAKGRERTLLRKVGIETGNLYSAFVALAIKQLQSGGELVAITPRSFCNGPYFNDFRRMMLDECSLNKIQVFNSRKSAFKADKVLQENVVYHLTKGEPQREKIIVYSSSCAEDSSPTVYEVPFEEVVQPNNPDRFIHIIRDEEERLIANRAGSLPCSLSDLGVQASTGKVVDFRTRENLLHDFVDGSVPLLFPQHIQNCAITWPIEGAKKPNALLNNENTANLVVPNGTYILTRRLTAKEEKRRIVAAIYRETVADVDVVGFDNKTNYFHADGKPLDDSIAKGLWAFLNSTLVDNYFRQMNGHTQVNATDLRVLRYPTKEQLLRIADAIDFVEFDQSKVDKLIESILI